MTSLGTAIEEAKFSISGGRVKVELGQATATVPVQRIGDLIRTLEGIRFILEGPKAAAASASQAPPAPRAEAAPAASAAEKPGKRKRRSRKRVGDALEKWMQDNPGWHTEEELLRAVKQNNMSDADPKRALKIALGKQANDLFVKDNQGRWKLKSDPSEAAAAPPAKAKRQRAPAAVTAQATPRAERKRRIKTKGEAAAAEAAEEPGPAPEAEGSGRKVLVKRGQSRKAATLSAGEVEARRQATEAIDSRRKTRWSRVSTSELERARKNLLGLGPGSKG